MRDPVIFCKLNFLCCYLTATLKANKHLGCTFYLHPFFLAYTHDSFPQLAEQSLLIKIPLFVCASSKSAAYVSYFHAFQILWSHSLQIIDLYSLEGKSALHLWAQNL